MQARTVFLATACTVFLAVEATARPEPGDSTGTGSAKAVPFTHEGGAWSLEYGPDGRLLASGGVDGTVRLWDAVSGRELHRCIGHGGRVTTLAFSPDGRRLASGGSDGLVFVWDTATGKRLLTCKGHTGWVLAVTFSPDGKTLATGSYDETARLWDASAGTERRRFEGHEAAVSGVVLMPDGKSLVTTGFDSTLRVWDTATGKQRHQLQRVKRGEVLGLRLVGGGRWVASTAANGSLMRGHPDSDEEGQWKQGSGGAGLSLGCSADGKTVIVSNNSGDVLLFESSTWRVITQFEAVRPPLPPRSPSQRGSEAVRSVALSPSGRELAVATDDGRIGVWPLVAVLTPERTHAWPLRPDDLPLLWDRLADLDPAVAYRAVSVLTSDPERGVPFLADKVRPAPPLDLERTRKCIADLGSEDFEVREKATAELEKMLPSAEGPMRRAMQDTGDLEVRSRLGRLLGGLVDGPYAAENLRRQRTLMALEQMDTPAARAVLKRLAAGAAGATLTEEAGESLRRLGPGQ